MARLAPFLALGMLAAAIALPALPPIRRALEAFADRAIIFLYVLMPLSALALVVLVINNLF